MRPRTDHPPDMPGLFIVEVAGRQVKLLPLRPTDPLIVGMKLREAVGIPADKTEMDAETMTKALQLVPLITASAVALSLYDDAWEFETPLLSRIGKQSAADVLAWADALDAELDAPTGRQAFPGDALKRIADGVNGSIEKAVEAEKNA